MGKKSKVKGYRAEREIVNLLQKSGINVKRIPLSGGIWWLKGDILFPNNRKGEVKIRKKINCLLYDMLADASYGFIRGDNRRWLVVMELPEFIELYKKAQ